jgi:hypothetical protein
MAMAINKQRLAQVSALSVIRLETDIFMRPYDGARAIFRRAKRAQTRCAWRHAAVV